MLEFTPKTYWHSADPSAGKIRNEFGRRIKQAIGSGDFSNVGTPPVPFAMRGGDFLPKLRDREVEIARISLNSTTWDVISIRARPIKRGIAYQVVDEYDLEYDFRPKTSKHPLSMTRLIHLINELNVDGASCSPTGHRESQLANTPEDIRRLDDFVIVSSEFYPNLATWFQREAAGWVETQLAAINQRGCLS